MWLWGSQPEETHQIIVQSYPLIQTREKQSYSTVERAIFLYIFLLRNQAFCHFFKVVLTLDLQVISSRICKGLSAVFGCGVFLFLSVWSRHRLKIIRFCLKWTEDSHEKWVKNLSDRNLIEPEKKALAKGLHFAISPQQLPIVDVITATGTTTKMNKLHKQKQNKSVTCPSVFFDFWCDFLVILTHEYELL